MASTSTLTSRKLTPAAPSADSSTPIPGNPTPAILPLEALFPRTRLFRPWGLRHWLLFLYAPIGVLLLLLRLLWLTLWTVCFFRLGMLFGNEAIENAFWRVFCWGIGIRTKISGLEHLINHKGPLVVAPNHVSEMDGLSTRLALGPSHFITPLHYSKDWFSLGLSAYLHPLYLVENDRDAIHKAIDASLKTSKHPVVVFPEGCLTNGKGLLLYHRFLFSLGVPILPVAIHFERFFPINMDTLCCPTSHNMFWLFFQPRLTWVIDVLPAESLREGENAEQFAARIQKETADHLGIPITNYLKGDKYGLVKAAQPTWPSFPFTL